MAAREGQLESLQLLIQHQALPHAEGGGQTSQMHDGIGTQFIYLAFRLMLMYLHTMIFQASIPTSSEKNPEKLTLSWFCAVKERR